MFRAEVKKNPGLAFRSGSREPKQDKESVLDSMLASPIIALQDGRRSHYFVEALPVLGQEDRECPPGAHGTVLW